MEQMSLEALKEQEANLIRELEIENCEKNILLQKHRQVLLNSTHLLRIYHQSSKEAIEIINKPRKEQPEIVEIEPVINEEEIVIVIKRNGLRLLWDSLDKLEFLRASLILKYLKNVNYFINSESSLKYFESKFIEKINQILTMKQRNDCSLTITALLLTCPNEFVEYLKLELLKDSQGGSDKIINFYNNIKIFKSPKTFDLFLEEETNFCEYPQIKNIKSQVPTVNLSELKDSIKRMTTEIFTAKITRMDNINGLPSIDVLKELELDEEVVDNILKKVKEFKLKGNSEKLKFHLSEFFDKLMKLIQSTIRSTTTSNSIVIDQDFNTKFSFLCENFKNFPPKELETILKSFDQTILNKSNIIFTIHRNEISALNSKNEIQIPSKLYLAVLLCENLIKQETEVLELQSQISEQSQLVLEQQSQILEHSQIQVSEQSQSQESEHYQSQSYASACFFRYIENIYKKFYEVWLNDIKSAFDKLKKEHNEIYALIWLSDSFLSLKVTSEHRSDIIKSLLDPDVINKYSSQAALLVGLFEPQSIPTPKLQNLNISEPKSELLPHFISI